MVKSEELLNKILNLKSVQEDIKEHQKMFLGVEERTRQSYALDNFFEQDYKEIFEQVPEIWRLLRELIREEVEWKTSDSKTFCESGATFKMDEYATGELYDLAGDLQIILKRRYEEGRSAWECPKCKRTNAFDDNKCWNCGFTRRQKP